MRQVLDLFRVATATSTAAVFLMLGVSVSAAYPKRAPQIPLQTGWDGISLQSYLNNKGESCDTHADQLDLQTWLAPVSGTARFALMMEIAGHAPQNSIGIYNAGQATPTKYLVFPGGAVPGWYATCLFSAPNNLQVKLYDANNLLQGTTNYSGVDLNNFGFYLQGPQGTFYSQDARNIHGRAQVITYAGTGAFAGKFWECFEDLPYGSSDADFQDSVLLLESVAPTPAMQSSWTTLKALFR